MHENFERLTTGFRLPLFAIIVAIAYYVCAKFGLSLSFKPDYIAALWPPNAVLLAVLFLTKPNHWAWFLIAIVPAELAADLPSGIPLEMALGFVFADWVEVLTASILFYKFSESPPDFATIRQMTMYIICCVIIAPFVAAFPGAVVTGLGNTEPAYWTRWVRWFLGDALTHLLFTPFLVLWSCWRTTDVQSRPRLFYLEFMALTATLFIVSITAFSGRVLSTDTVPAILYLPLPILLWAAVRFGPRGIFSCSVFVAVVCIWSGSRGYGPFIEYSAARNVINMQIFLSITLTPLLFLAALVKDHRRSEDQLRESEQRFRDLTESTSDWVWEVDREGVYTYSSPKVYELLGYHPEEIIGKKPFDLMTPDEAKRISDFFAHIASSKVSFEFLQNVNIHKNGSPITMETSGVPFFDDKDVLLGFRGIDRDVTGRKEAEAALQESEKRLRDLYENAPIPYFSVGADGRILRCNRRAKELIGYDDEALNGKLVLDLYADNQHGRGKALQVLEKFQAGEDIRDEELLMQKADGTPIWTSLSVNAIKNANGQVVESRSMVVDITERKSAEQALADSERRMADIIEFLPDPTWVIDTDSRVIAWNRAMEGVSGISKKEIMGKGDFAYAIPFYGKPRPVLIDLVLKRNEQWEKDYLTLKEKDGVLIETESFHPTMGDGGRYFAGTASRLYNAQGDVVGAIETIRDITTSKRSEQDRERLIAELQEAVAKVRTLSGMLPICSSCKKIRDDKGYWNQIESYISERSTAEFSHSLCPDCIKQLYPDLDMDEE